MHRGQQRGHLGARLAEPLGGLGVVLPDFACVVTGRFPYAIALRRNAMVVVELELMVLNARLDLTFPQRLTDAEQLV